MQADDSSESDSGSLTALEQVWDQINASKHFKIASNTQNNLFKDALIKSGQHSIHNYSRMERSSNSSVRPSTHLDYSPLPPRSQQFPRKQSATRFEKHENHNHFECDQLIEEKNRQIEILTLKLESLALRKNAADTPVPPINTQNLSKDEKALLKLELQEARNTIQSLLQIVRKIPKYRELAERGQEIKNPQILRSCNKQAQIICANESKAMWTEAEAYKVMLNMKIKHDFLSEECIQDVLKELTKLWENRENSKIAKIRFSYESQITALKLKAESTYNEVMAKKKIERLKKELQTNKNLRKGIGITNIKVEGELRDELRFKNRELKLLEERVKLLQSNTNTKQQSLYIEGALWLVDRLNEELKETQEIYAQLEYNHSQKLAEEENSINKFALLQKDTFDEIQMVQASLVDKLANISTNLRKKLANLQAIR